MNRLVLDVCPDSRGFGTIRLDDGSLGGDTESGPVATVYNSQYECLLAAAPDLLAALEVVAAMAAHDWGNDHPAIAQARTAIAKAKGN